MAPSNPFTYGPMITDPDRFIGRRAELEIITARLNGPQPQGSAVVGPRRIGKSSLLHYLYQPRQAESLRCAANQQIIYLDAQQGECTTPDAFRRTLTQKLLATQPPTGAHARANNGPICKGNWNATRFAPGKWRARRSPCCPFTQSFV